LHLIAFLRAFEPPLLGCRTFNLPFHPHFYAFLRVKLKPPSVLPAFSGIFAGENASPRKVLQLQQFLFKPKAAACLFQQ
jgi:hypothetical protein